MGIEYARGNIYECAYFDTSFLSNSSESRWKITDIQIEENYYYSKAPLDQRFAPE